MEKQENEITIGQLFGIVKKSLKRGLLYILITAIVLTSVMLTVKAFTETKVYTTTVSFSSTDESMLSKLNSNKASVINNALKNMNKYDANTSETVLSNFSVAAKDTNAENKEYTPDTFVISLKADKDISFSNTEYKNVLDNIAEGYKKIFTKKDVQSLSFNYSAQMLDSYEYLQQVMDLSEIVSNYISQIKTEIKNFEGLDEFSTEGSRSVNDILSSLNETNTSLESLKNTIVLNKIEKNSGSLSNYIALNKTLYTNKKTSLESLLTELNKSLEAYGNVIKTVTNKDVNGTSTIVYNDENFIELVKEKNEAAQELSNATEKLGTFTGYESKIGTTTDESVKSTVVGTAEKDGLIKTNSNAIQSAVKDYNALAKAYNETQSSSSTLTRLDGAHTSIENAIGTKTVLLMVVVACFIAYIVAFSQTFAKQKSNGYFNR